MKGSADFFCEQNKNTFSIFDYDEKKPTDTKFRAVMGIGVSELSAVVVIIRVENHFNHFLADNYSFFRKVSIQFCCK